MPNRMTAGATAAAVNQASKVPSEEVDDSIRLKADKAAILDLFRLIDRDDCEQRRARLVRTGSVGWPCG